MTTRRTGEARSGMVARPPRNFRPIGFFRDVVLELRRVVWPSKEEATRLTIIVIIVSVSVGVALGVIDIGFSAIMTRIL